jgi:high affinity Mn2+ porin
MRIRYLNSLIDSAGNTRALRAGQRFLCLPFLLALAIPLLATDCTQPDANQTWNDHYQFTAVPQGHGGFHSPYEGERSLVNETEIRSSFTATAFLGLRLPYDTQIYFNPEVAAGKGLSAVNGLAGFSDGEITRVTNPAPQAYVARLYAVHSWSIGSETECVEAGPNQLAGLYPKSSFSITAGRFAITDFFDDNAYAHDPRGQFLNWALMYNGAWDYPSNTRGYTNGAVAELKLRRWSLRLGEAMEPAQANALRLDWHFATNHSEVVEGERRWQSGKLRVLGYQNHANMGSYNQALLQSGAPSVTATRRPDAIKYGFGTSFEQKVGDGIGVFSRLGWDDGGTESWAYTAIDRTASGGVRVEGKRWRRPKDVVASAVVFNGLSGVHREYLAQGGYDFIIGDGRLNYGLEAIWESYYAWSLPQGFTITPDYQRVWNPGYNRDRGPVSIYAMRLHWEM